MKDDLAGELRRVWHAAPAGNRVVHMHLFGIEHANDLASLNLKELKALASRAGLSPEYGTELRKMVRLAEYVQVVNKPALAPLDQAGSLAHSGSFS